MTRPGIRLLLTVLAVTSWPGVTPAHAASQKYGELLKRLPENANVLLLVDVEGLLSSPLGQREGWRDKLVGRPAGILGVSGDASKVVAASFLDFSTLEERGKLGMVQTRGPLPELGVLAAREGGYVEQVETQDVAWTPRGFYLFTFPDRILGFGMPTDRKLLAGWIRDTIIRPRTFPPSWANLALFRADAGSQIVLAVDLKDAISPKQAELWLKGFEGVAKANLDPGVLASRLAGIKSAMLQFDVRESIQGTLTVEFQFPISYAGPVAKELVLATLEGYGAEVEDFKGWNLAVQGNNIVLAGPTSEDAVRRIVRTVGLPGLTPESQSQTYERPPAQAPAAPPQDLAVRASQQYFRSVNDILSSLKGTSRPTYASQKLWYDRYARQIEQLPILNVDVELLDWGSKVARTLREMAFGINANVNDRNYRLASAPNGAYVGYAGGYGYAGAESKGYDAAVLKRQGDALLSTQLDARWEVLATATSDMRRKMVEKYKVDF